MSGLAAEHRAAVLAAAELCSPAPAGELSRRLYARWYAAPGPVCPRDCDAAPIAGAYRVAHAAAGSPWLPARIVHRGMAGVVVVRESDAGLLRAVVRADYAHRPGGADGDDVLVSPVRGGVVAEGWWRTWSAAWNPTAPPERVSRVYIAPAPGAAVAVVGALTRVVTALDGAWLLKVGVDPVTLARPDAVVLYLPDDLLDEALLGRLAAATTDLRRAAQPPLARVVAPGMAWAQGPAGERSFGEAVCELVAAALAPLQLGPPETRSADAAVAAVVDALQAAGVDPARPHLRAVPPAGGTS